MKSRSQQVGKEPPKQLGISVAHVGFVGLPAGIDVAGLEQVKEEQFVTRDGQLLEAAGVGGQRNAGNEACGSAHGLHLR